MAFSTQVKLNGNPKTYQLNPQVKKFTLKDAGFKETKSGNFSFKQSLSGSPFATNGIHLKIMVNKDLNGLKMSIVNGNGFNKINIFKNENEKYVQQFNYIMENLMLRKIIEQ